MTDSISRRSFLKASSLALGSPTLPAMSPGASAAMVQAGASAAPDVTRQLASYVVNSDWTDIPDAARYEAVRSVFNWVGCCLGLGTTRDDGPRPGGAGGVLRPT